MTLAPELRGAPALIRFFERRGVVPAFGHSDANYDQTCRAAKGGLHYATHLFNAMNGLHHRDPGAVTALIENPDVAVELISDGEHVHAAAMRLVTEAKSPEKVVLVSDSVPPCGLRDGRYDFAGGQVELRKGRITRDDGRLAGSALTLDRAVRVQVKDVGTSLPNALRFASENPARVAQIARRAGTIAKGRPADLVLLDAKKLTVRATWLAGELVYRRGKL